MYLNRRYINEKRTKLICKGQIRVFMCLFQRHLIILKIYDNI